MDCQRFVHGADPIVSHSADWEWNRGDRGISRGLFPGIGFENSFN